MLNLSLHLRTFVSPDKVVYHLKLYWKGREVLCLAWMVNYLVWFEKGLWLYLDCLLYQIKSIVSVVGIFKCCKWNWPVMMFFTWDKNVISKVCPVRLLLLSFLVTDAGSDFVNWSNELSTLTFLYAKIQHHVKRSIVFKEIYLL